MRLQLACYRSLQTRTTWRLSRSLFLWRKRSTSSWEFLLEGLHELGFGDDFIDFVKLMYSDGPDAVPTRQMYVNGHLGPQLTSH